MTLSAAKTIARDAVETSLARIDLHNPQLNAIITVTREQALDAAERCLDPDPMTVVVKDNVDVAGVTTTAASPLLRDNLATVDAFAVAAMRRAGAIILGKANMHEWAFGASGLSARVAPVVNPWGADHVPGGSSSGSAVAVAAGMARGALGSDTAGSIRIPAAFNGVSGLRPTVGLVSNRGSLPVSRAFDTLGPIARCVKDVARLLGMIAGFDPEDPWSRRPPDFPAPIGIRPIRRGLRLGVVGDWCADCLHPDMALAFENALNTLQSLGATLVPIEIAEAATAPEIVAKIVLVDAYLVHRDRLALHRDDYGPDLLPRLDAGAAAAGVDYAEALHRLECWRHRMRTAFDRVDAILTPTTSHPAPTTAEETSGAGSVRAIARGAYAWSAWNGPSLSIPCGYSDRGLPLGLCISGRPFDEATVLEIGHAFQQVTNHHLRMPPLSDLDQPTVPQI